MNRYCDWIQISLGPSEDVGFGPKHWEAPRNRRYQLPVVDPVYCDLGELKFRTQTSLRSTISIILLASHSRS